MKAREFLAQQENAPEIRSKVTEFKENLKKSQTVKPFETCHNCGGTLHFYHHVDWVRLQASEKGCCLNCQARTPTRYYPLN